MLKVIGDIFEVVGDIFDEIMKGFFRGIGFILSIIFIIFILIVILEIKTSIAS